MRRAATLVFGLMCSAAVLAHSTHAPASADEETVWKQERAYWRYVEANDLAAYRSLWHESFLGWPSVSATPVHKDHITDWITSETSKGLKFKSIAFKPAGMQKTGDVIVAFYWITSAWVDKDGHGATDTSRITHTWLKNGNSWQIIGGMSMPESAAPPK